MSFHPYTERLAIRKRRCHVYENPPDCGYHLALVDDGGSAIIADVVVDHEIALWLATLVNEALILAEKRREKAQRAQP